ncbi:MAG TPA: cell division protein ZapA [Chitinophagaceae bacterium]|nr:cell division protein ZapA [Chitinophagaceae bacterium]
MEEEKLIPINVVVADRSYRLKVHPHEEEQVRGAVKRINEKILEFKTTYAGKDLQDYIAMCLITYATEGNSGEPTPETSLSGNLGRLEESLDNALA